MITNGLRETLERFIVRVLHRYNDPFRNAGGSSSPSANTAKNMSFPHPNEGRACFDARKPRERAVRFRSRIGHRPREVRLRFMKKRVFRNDGPGQKRSAEPETKTRSVLIERSSYGEQQFLFDFIKELDRQALKAIKP